MCSLIGAREGIILEQLRGETVRDPQVVQPLCPPLAELQQQWRKLLPGGDHLLQKADGLSNTDTNNITSQLLLLAGQKATEEDGDDKQEVCSIRAGGIDQGLATCGSGATMQLFCPSADVLRLIIWKYIFTIFLTPFIRRGHSFHTAC